MAETIRPIWPQLIVLGEAYERWASRRPHCYDARFTSGGPKWTDVSELMLLRRSCCLQLICVLLYNGVDSVSGMHLSHPGSLSKPCHPLYTCKRTTYDGLKQSDCFQTRFLKTI